MKEHKIKIVALQDGRIVIDGVPVRKGQQVEITLRIEDRPKPTYPLRGLPIHYQDPFLPAVPETEWDASK